MGRDRNADPVVSDPEAPRRRRRWWLWGGGIVLLLLIAAGGWVTYRTMDAYQNLTAAKSAISAGQQAASSDLTSLDRDELTATVEQAQLASAAARNDVEDPLFRLATGLPWVGDDLAAVATVATTVDDVATQVLPPLLDLVDVIDPSTFETSDSSIDLTPLVAAAPVLKSADDAVAQQQQAIDEVDRSGLTSAVSGGVNELSSSLTKLRSLTSAGTKLTELLPPMLGSEGTRRYLVVFQNLAELRSTGGIFGSYAVLTATDGHLEVSGQGATSRTIGRFDIPVTTLTAEQQALYGTNPAAIPMDVNFTPDFPTAATNFALMFQQRIDPAPLDGVIALDPVVLADVLKGFDPVNVEGLTIDSDSVVKFLLSDAYTLFTDKDQSDRDAFLSEANAAAFSAVTGTPRDMGAVIDGLRDAADDHRILLYSAHPDEQAQLQTAGLTGELPASDSATAPTFGIYLNDRTYKGSKLGYYLSGAVDLTAGSCTPEGSREVTATVDLDFDAPSSGLPEHVSGSGPIPYVLVTEFRVFAPTGATVTAAEFDGTPVTMVNGTDLDRSVGQFTVNLQPGSKTTVTVHFLLPAAGGASSNPTRRCSRPSPWRPPSRSGRSPRRRSRPATHRSPTSSPRSARADVRGDPAASVAPGPDPSSRVPTVVPTATGLLLARRDGA